jgi:hypothetical protein
MSYKNVFKDILAIFVCNILYFTYIELNPKTPGIVFRYNDKNEKQLSLGSIKEFIKFPYTKLGIQILWYPENWDINHSVVILGMFGIYKLAESLSLSLFNYQCLGVEPQENP